MLKTTPQPGPAVEGGLGSDIVASRAALNNSAVHILSSECGDQGPPNK